MYIIIISLRFVIPTHKPAFLKGKFPRDLLLSECPTSDAEALIECRYHSFSFCVTSQFSKNYCILSLKVISVDAVLLPCLLS